MTPLTSDLLQVVAQLLQGPLLPLRYGQGRHVLLGGLLLFGGRISIGRLALLPGRRSCFGGGWFSRGAGTAGCAGRFGNFRQMSIDLGQEGLDLVVVAPGRLLVLPLAGGGMS